MIYERISYIIILVKLYNTLACKGRSQEIGVLKHTSNIRVYIGTCTENMSILTKEDVKELHILEFRLGNNSYGIDIDTVLEIKKYEKARFIPGAHPWIDGVFVFRNQVVTNINMFKCCKIEEEQDVESYMNIIVQVGDDPIGILVSSVLDTHIVPMEDIKPIEENKMDEFRIGNLSNKEKLVTIIDVTKLVSVLKKEKIA